MEESNYFHLEAPSPMILLTIYCPLVIHCPLILIPKPRVRTWEWLSRVTRLGLGSQGTTV